jgi:hypothetical protein
MILKACLCMLQRERTTSGLSQSAFWIIPTLSGNHGTTKMFNMTVCASMLPSSAGIWRVSCTVRLPVCHVPRLDMACDCRQLQPGSDLASTIAKLSADAARSPKKVEAAWANICGARSVMPAACPSLVVP